jgi:hypothetical protein
MGKETIPEEFQVDVDTVLQAEAAELDAYERELFPDLFKEDEETPPAAASSDDELQIEDEAEESSEQEDDSEGEEGSEEQKLEVAAKQEKPPGETPKEEEEDELVKELKPSLNKHESAYEIKSGDETVKVARDAKWVVKASGQLQEVTTQDLIESYASKTENKRLADKNIQESRQNAADRQQVLGIIQEFAEKAKTDPPGAVAVLLGRAGLDPLVVTRAYRTKLMDQAKEYLALSPEQRQALELKEENEYYRRLNEARNSQAQEQEKETQLRTTVNQAIETYQMGDVQTFKETFVATKAYYEQLAAKDPEFEIPTITADVVGQFYRASQQFNLTREVLSEVNPNLLRNQQAIEQVLATVRKHNPPREKLLAAVKKIYGSESGASKEAQKAKPPSKPASQKPKASDKSRNGTKRDDPGLDIDATPDMSGDNWRKYL